MGQTGTVRALKFRDRFYTSQVARAITSPLGIVLAGAGLAVGAALNLPIIAAVALGAAAYAGRVAVAIPRGIDADGIDPFSLGDPWRTYVWQARRARRHFADAVRSAKDGPLRDRLEEIEERIALGVNECWRVAQQGQSIAEARTRIDIHAVTSQLSNLHAMNPVVPAPGSAMAQTIEAVQAQLDTAKRLDAVIADTDARLRLLNARLDESVTRAIELSARVGSADDLGSVLDDVDVLVGDLEALRQALGETDAVSARHVGVPVLPGSADVSTGTDTARLAPPSTESLPAGPPPGSGLPGVVPGGVAPGQTIPGPGQVIPGPGAVAPPTAATWPPSPGPGTGQGYPTS